MGEQQWRRVRLEGIVELSIPAAMEVSKEQAFESPVGIWEGGGMTVVVDATVHADPLTSAIARRGARSSTETIGGEPSLIVSYVEDQGTQVEAAHLRSGDPSRPSVTVVVRSDPGVDRSLATRILMSVTRL